jgi:Flp pilus assembly pilin Flp
MPCERRLQHVQLKWKPILRPDTRQNNDIEEDGDLKTRHPALVEFMADERGTTAIEYCMIGAMLSILILAGAQLIGGNISSRFLGPLVSGFP